MGLSLYKQQVRRDARSLHTEADDLELADVTSNMSFLALNDTWSAIDYRPQYGFVLEVEKRFHYRHSGVEAWFRNHWHFSVYLSLVYLVVIFSLKRWMESRPPYGLRKLLFAWSLLLSVFSILGAIRMWTEMMYVLRTYGIAFSVCRSHYENNATGFWVALFIVSKAPELLDTVFIVLRKRNLIFLHWYHHVTALIYSWWSYRNAYATGRWFCFMNCNVHGIMYAYFALRAASIRVPRYVNVTITTLQLLQMIIGMVVIAADLYVHSQGAECDPDDFTHYVALLMYISYFILFAQFFYNSYLSKKDKLKTK